MRYYDQIKMAVAVSAPGKVLLAGGYLVLDRKYSGLVLGLDARIHVKVEPSDELVVTSPQFVDAVWRYGRDIERASDVKPNLFVETTLKYVWTYARALGVEPQAARVTILADESYYSTSSAERFGSLGVTIWDAHKTGLGSSAALVTALTGGLLRFLGIDVTLERLHNLAQAAHCAAQGKIGSGFDVASAVYGSCLYRRFSPSILDSRPLREIVDGQWDTEITQGVALPAGLRLVMCDVDCGSSTPSMVKAVQAWRQTDPEAEHLWERLHAANQTLAHSLDQPTLKEAIQRVRRLIQEMTTKSKVPIEPDSQTQLLDRLEAIPGVIGGVVPGAGGYDAIALIIQDDAIDLITDSITGGFKVLPVREDHAGFRDEDPNDYETSS